MWFSHEKCVVTPRNLSTVSTIELTNGLRHGDCGILRMYILKSATHLPNRFRSNMVTYAISKSLKQLFGERLPLFHFNVYQWFFLIRNKDN